MKLVINNDTDQVIHRDNINLEQHFVGIVFSNKTRGFITHGTHGFQILFAQSLNFYYRSFCTFQELTKHFLDEAKCSMYVTSNVNEFYDWLKGKQ